MSDSPTLGTMIRERRLEQGLSLGQLATKLGHTSASVRRWERGEDVPSNALIVRIADVLDLDEAAMRAALTETPAAAATEPAATNEPEPATSVASTIDEKDAPQAPELPWEVPDDAPTEQESAEPTAVVTEEPAKPEPPEAQAPAPAPGKSRTCRKLRQHQHLRRSGRCQIPSRPSNSLSRPSSLPSRPSSLPSPPVELPESPVEPPEPPDEPILSSAPSEPKPISPEALAETVQSPVAPAPAKKIAGTDRRPTSRRLPPKPSLWWPRPARSRPTPAPHRSLRAPFLRGRPWIGRLSRTHSPCFSTPSIAGSTGSA